MPQKRALYLYDREGKQYFAGWNGEAPLWSDEVDLAMVQHGQKEADDNYELLRNLGFDIKIQE